jgi:hypothetical protein
MLIENKMSTVKTVVRSLCISRYDREQVRYLPTGCRPPHLPPIRVAKTSKNQLNRLPTGIGERFIQTISNLGHAALLRRCELPPTNESDELTRGAL